MLTELFLWLIPYNLSSFNFIFIILIIGLFILLHVYQLNIGTHSYATIFFGARFIVHFKLQVSAPIGGHLQVVYKHIKIYTRQSRTNSTDPLNIYSDCLEYIFMCL
jgi:hypothetical protein